MRRDLQPMMFPVASGTESSYEEATVPGISGVTSELPVPVGVRPVGQAPHQFPVWVLAVLGVGSGVVLGGVVWAATHLHADPTLHTAALFVHLIALVVSFGAVLAVDWFALLWLLGHRSLADLSKVTAAAQLPIWLGLLGLVLSGALLRPDLTHPLIWVKLALVLLVTLNGLHAVAIDGQLRRVQAGNLPTGLLSQAVVAAVVSQLCWWGATIIGFLSVQH